jgi:serine/threonine protein kinase
MMKSVSSWNCKYLLLFPLAVFLMHLYRMNGGDLFDRITSKGVLSEHEARVAMRHILNAVDFLHDRSLVHRDLKVPIFPS